MFSEPNASRFGYASTFYCAELECILSMVLSCYELILQKNIKVSNNENFIRDRIVIDYLKNDSIRHQLNIIDYHFERESLEDATIGRTDIKVISMQTFVEQKAYYIIECKRLDDQNTKGATGLNSKYISDGICRFVSGLYTTYNNVNAMIGFVVVQLDIQKNVDEINKLLDDQNSAKCIDSLKYYKIKDGFNYSYLSKHDASTKQISLYHLMLDFSAIII